MQIKTTTLTAIIIGAALAISHPAFAQKTATCSGTLINVWLKPKAEWPLAVIYDEAEGRTCTFDRSGAGHDPLQACSAGEGVASPELIERLVLASPRPTRSRPSPINVTFNE
jgi:hypothetical protein